MLRGVSHERPVTRLTNDLSVGQAQHQDVLKSPIIFDCLQAPYRHCRLTKYARAREEYTKAAKETSPLRANPITTSGGLEHNCPVASVAFAMGHVILI